MIHALVYGIYEVMARPLEWLICSSLDLLVKTFIPSPWLPLGMPTLLRGSSTAILLPPSPLKKEGT